MRRAVFDHYRAMVQTICQRLAQTSAGEQAQRTGGSTFTLDVWPGHPLAEEASASLARYSKQHAELYARIEAHNAAHGRPEDYDQAVIYTGQHVWPRRRNEGQT
jgi:hypothetical protein